MKAGLDLPAVSRWCDLNTFSLSCSLSLPHGENQTTDLPGWPPCCSCTASTAIDCGQRAVAPGKARRLLPACVYSSHRSSPRLFPLQFHTSLPFITLHRGDRFLSAFLFVRCLPCAASQALSVAFTRPSYLQAVQIKSFPR